jgi:hypothetical protein
MGLEFSGASEGKEGVGRLNGRPSDGPRMPPPVSALPRVESRSGPDPPPVC